MELSNGAQVVLAQVVELPDFSGLPPFAQGVMYTVAAIALGLSIIIPRIGFLFGKKADPVKSDPTFAAVVVDPAALNANTAAINNLAVEIRITREVGIVIRRAR